jgi:hypothetical protein
MIGKVLDEALNYEGPVLVDAITDEERAAPCPARSRSTKPTTSPSPAPRQKHFSMIAPERVKNQVRELV